MCAQVRGRHSLAPSPSPQFFPPTFSETPIFAAKVRSGHIYLDLNLMDQKPRIAIIGAGNIGRAIAEGLMHRDAAWIPSLSITRRQTDQLADLANQGVTVTPDNRLAAQQSEWIILAVKPFKVKDIMAEIQPVLVQGKHKIISVATGITQTQIQEWAGMKLPVFRAMPNTAIEVGESMTCVSASDASPAEEQFVLDFFGDLGQAVLIKEELMDSATVLAACGIAFAMRFIRANMQGGIEIGFDSQTALRLAVQTVKGAAMLLQERGTHPEAEIDKVTTPMGCTIAGLNQMEHKGFSSSMIQGIKSSFGNIRD